MSQPKLTIRKRMRKNPRMRRTRRALAAWFMRHIGVRLFRLFAKTWKVEVHGQECLEEVKGKHGGYFMALWHGKMLVGMPHHSGPKYQILVSPSADGDISENLLLSFGYGVIRGSSSRGGARALREMLGALRQGHALVITPDGPRGPVHSMNPGLAWMARATGHGVVPCGFAAESCWRANSWDRLCIPKPGSRVAIHYEDPVFVSRKATEEEQLAATELIRERMLHAEKQAAKALGMEFDPAKQSR
jgi:lysophospholipid acyltransferase (LPLAT)-like uncharacterized protein